MNLPPSPIGLKQVYSIASRFQQGNGLQNDAEYPTITGASHEVMPKALIYRPFLSFLHLYEMNKGNLSYKRAVNQFCNDA